MQTLLLNLLLSLCFLWVSLSGRVIRYPNIPSENNVEDEEISDENIDKVYSNFVSSSGLTKRNYYRKYNLSDLGRSMNDNNKQNDTNPTIGQLSNNDDLFESMDEHNNTRHLNPSCSIYLNFIVGDNVTIIQKHMHLPPQNRSKGFTEYKGPEETNIYVNTIENTKGLMDETLPGNVYQKVQNRIENQTEVHLKDNKGTANLNKDKKKTNPMRVQLLTDIFAIINNTNTNQTQKGLIKGAAQNIQLSAQESTNGSKSTEENIQDNVYLNIHENTTSSLDKGNGIAHLDSNIYSEDVKKSTVTRTSSTPASLVDTTVPVTSNLLLNSETTVFTKQAQANISASISTEKPFYLTERSPTVCLPSNFSQGQLKESTSSDCEDGLNQVEVGSPITFFPTEDCTANLQVKQLIKTNKSIDDSDYDDMDTSGLELGTPITFFPPGCNGNIPTRQSGFAPNVLFQQNVAPDNSKHE